MEISLSTRPGRGCTVVEVVGELDISSAPQLRSTLQRAVDAGDRRLVVDLGGVSFMDSTALGAMAGVYKSLRGVGGTLAVANLQPPVRSVFAITSVDQAITVYDTVQEAEEDTDRPSAS